LQENRVDLIPKRTAILRGSYAHKIYLFGNHGFYSGMFITSISGFLAGVFYKINLN
jgi:hypothetical protein